MMAAQQQRPQMQGQFQGQPPVQQAPGGPGFQVRAPHTSPQQTPPQLSPVTSMQQQRPQWSGKKDALLVKCIDAKLRLATSSGETHPALAQVPRTPQQIQHIQRLQMQREQQQQQMSPNQQQMVRPPVPMPGQPQTQLQQPQPQPGPQGQGQNGSQQKTKVALQNMLSNRAMSPQSQVQQVPGPPVVTGPQAPTPVQVQQSQPQVMVPQGPHGQPPQRLQMINVPHTMAAVPQPQFQQLQRQPHPQQGPPQGPPQFMQQPPQSMASGPVPPRGPGPHQMQMPPGAPAPQHAMRFAGAMGPRPGPPQGPPQPMVMQAQPRPAVPRPLFHGHDPGTKRKLLTKRKFYDGVLILDISVPPDLCFLGCIFMICDYQDDPEQKNYCDGWKKVIRQFGGEVEDAYHPRMTHVLCKSQDSSVAMQALREGKRLVTVFWLNDIVVKKVVMPPWKAIHFPLPANFDRPCENMILTLTGFEGRDRDWVKEMIKIAGAKYTSYFTKHNHAIICRSCEGEKYKKAKEWKTPTVSIQWLNDVFFGNMNAVQCMNNPKYQNFRTEDPFKIEFSLVPSLMAAWKTPIRVTPVSPN